jgi:hypothetical protein
MKSHLPAGRPRRAWPPAARIAAIIITTATLALPLAACGGPAGSPAAGGSASSPATNLQKAVAFSRCVRDRGVPNWPDPTSSGQIAKESARQLGVSNAQLQVALNACQHLLPNTGNIDDNPAALNQWWSQLRQFARCMRSHGVPNWPDPSPYPQDPVRPTFNLHAAGIGFHQGAQPGNIVDSPQIEARVRACESAVHEDVSGWFD